MQDAARIFCGGIWKFTLTVARAAESSLAFWFWLPASTLSSCWTLPKSFKRQQGSCKVRFWPKVFTNFDFQASFLSLENNKNVLICWPVTQIRVYRGNFTKMCPSTPHQTERTNKCRLNLSYLSWRLEIKGNQWHHWKAQTLFKSVLHDWKLAKEELEDENRYEMYTAGRVQLWPFPGGILLPKFQ